MAWDGANIGLEPAADSYNGCGGKEEHGLPVAGMVCTVDALEQLGQHRSQHHPFTDVDSPTHTRSAAPPRCPARTTPRRGYPCWSPMRHDPHILFFMFCPALSASCSVALCSLKCFSSCSLKHMAFTHQDFFRTQGHHQNIKCPVDDSRPRHRAIEDVGVKKSLQLWINLASNGQVIQPRYHE